MPSTKKTLHFMCSALATALSVGVMGYCMSTQWATMTMECARIGSSFFNGTAVITLELFVGILNRNFCPSFGGQDPFQGKFHRLSKGQFTGRYFSHLHTSIIYTHSFGFISPGLSRSSVPVTVTMDNQKNTP